MNVIKNEIILYWGRIKLLQCTFWDLTWTNSDWLIDRYIEMFYGKKCMIDKGPKGKRAAVCHFNTLKHNRFSIVRLVPNSVEEFIVLWHSSAHCVEIKYKLILLKEA